MKVIDVPEAISLDLGLDPILAKLKDQPIPNTRQTFYFFMKEAIDSYKPFGQGTENIFRAVKVFAIVDAAEKEKAKTMAFEDADYDEVKKAVESSSWATKVARQMKPFFDAALNAQDVKESGKK